MAMEKESEPPTKRSLVMEENTGYSKGGTNPPNTSSVRPPPPGGRSTQPITEKVDAADALTEQSEQIGLYEATTPPAKPDGSTKWPRYFESADKRGPEYRRIVDGPGERPRWFDGSTSEICSSLSELLSAECIIETDAEGNDLHKLPYTDGIMPTQPIGGEGAKVEVKRYDTSHILRCVDGKILDVPVVKASDHDAAMKAKDENIAWWKATVDMHDERAERAEAEAKALRFSIVSHMGGDDIELDASLDELNAACKKAGQLNYDLGIAKVGAEAEVAELMCEIRDLQATNDDQGDALIAATKRAEQVAAEWERLRKSHEQSEAKRRELVELLEDCTITIGKIHGPQPDELASLNKSIYAALADDAKGGW